MGVDEDAADFRVGFSGSGRAGVGWIEGVNVVRPFEFDRNGAVAGAVVGFDSADDGHCGEVLDEDDGGMV